MWVEIVMKHALPSKKVHKCNEKHLGHMFGQNSSDRRRFLIQTLRLFSTHVHLDMHTQLSTPMTGNCFCWTGEGRCKGDGESYIWEQFTSGGSKWMYSAWPYIEEMTEFVCLDYSQG